MHPLIFQDSIFHDRITNYTTKKPSLTTKVSVENHKVKRIILLTLCSFAKTLRRAGEKALAADGYTALKHVSNLYIGTINNRSSMKKISLFLFLLLIISQLLLYSQEPESRYIPETDPLVLEKLERWQDLKFGLLMHWGTYSQWGIVESWSICAEDEDWCRRSNPNYVEYKREYENLQTTFNMEQEHWLLTKKERFVLPGRGTIPYTYIIWQMKENPFRHRSVWDHIHYQQVQRLRC